MILSIVGNSTLAFGLNVEKLSLCRNEELPQSMHRACHKQPIWCAGFAVFICGNLLNFAAMSQATTSMLAPLGSVSIVSASHKLAFAKRARGS